MLLFDLAAHVSVCVCVRMSELLLLFLLVECWSGPCQSTHYAQLNERYVHTISRFETESFRCVVAIRRKKRIPYIILLKFQGIAFGNIHDIRHDDCVYPRSIEKQYFSRGPLFFCFFVFSALYFQTGIKLYGSSKRKFHNAN